MKKCSLLFLVICISLLIISKSFTDELWIPTIDGEWWSVTGQPDLGEYTSERQQPVDFGVWQAKDGTWQLWSCIRHTNIGGNTRLFYRWEGEKLTQPDWKPMGIAMTAKPELGESPGGMQAPHVVLFQGKYHMAYGDWNNICFAVSEDGKEFKRVIQPNGKTGVFTEGMGVNTRDAMLIQIDGLWYCYYTASPHNGYVYCRTSPDLKTWSHSCVVQFGGRAGDGRWQHECPHVVEFKPGLFYLFRNIYYGQNMENWVYRSHNPLYFGIDDDTGFVRTLEVAAPEIIQHEGQYYIASLKHALDGIKIARLKWVKVQRPGKAVFDFDDPDVRKKWKEVEGDLVSVFCTSTRSNFQSPTKYFIGTAELSNGTFDDDRTGKIISPEFVLEENVYTVFVSGGPQYKNCYVAIVDAKNGKELERFHGTRNNAFKSYRFPTISHQGKTVRIEVVDNGKGSWGHINFGGIFMDKIVE